MSTETKTNLTLTVKAMRQQTEGTVELPRRSST